MLDIEKRTPQQQKTAENAIKSPQALTELLEGLRSKKCAIRYADFKAVYLISEDHPEMLYPRWTFFEDLLKSKNNTFVFYAIHVLANLAKVDEAGKFGTIFDQFFNILDGDALIPACHVAYVSHKIARAKPKLADNITRKLLRLRGNPIQTQRTRSSQRFKILLRIFRPDRKQRPNIQPSQGTAEK